MERLLPLLAHEKELYRPREAKMVVQINAASHHRCDTVGYLCSCVSSSATLFCGERLMVAQCVGFAGQCSSTLLSSTLRQQRFATHR